MASAPDWSDEEKRRRQQPERSSLQRAWDNKDVARYREGGAVGVVGGAVGDFVRGVGEGVARSVTIPLAGVVGGEWATRALTRTPAAAPAAAAAPIGGDNDPNTPWPTVSSRATPGLAPGRAPAPGLTRVVRTADGVYTDDPNAQGEVRYYDAIGNRADAPQMPSTGGPTIRDNTSLARWQSENRFNVNDPDVQAAMVQQGAASQAQAQRMGAQGAAALASLRRQILPPEQRAALEQSEIAAGADDRASAARLQAAQIEAGGRKAAAQTAAQARAAEQLLAQDRWAREFAANPETAEAAMQQELGALENYTPAERRTLLTDPTNPQAARLRAMVRGRLAEATGNPDVTPAQIRRSGGLRRIFGSPYNDGAGYWGNGFDPNDFGMSEEEFADFVNADRDARARR